MRRRDLLRLATGAGAIGTSAVCRARTESKDRPIAHLRPIGDDAFLFRSEL